MSDVWPSLPFPHPGDTAAIQTERLNYRSWTAGDAAALASAWADPSLSQWMALPPDRSEAYASRWIAGEAVRRERGLALDVVLELEGAVVGEVGLSGFDPGNRSAQIGYWVTAERRGAGLAVEALRAVSAWSIATLGLDTLVATCHLGNVASVLTARRAGFQLLAASPDQQVPDEHGIFVLCSAD